MLIVENIAFQSLGMEENDRYVLFHPALCSMQILLEFYLEVCVTNGRGKILFIIPLSDFSFLRE